MENPTYDVVGELQGFDERDNVLARGSLVPGSPEYLQYYSMHPELEKADAKLRVFYDPKLAEERRRKSFPDDLVSLALVSTWRMIPAAVATAVDGLVSPKQVPISPEKAVANVKGLGRYLGADLVRISRLNPAWVYTHNGRWLYEGRKWGEKNDLSHCFAITLGFAQKWEMLAAARRLSLTSEIDTGTTYGKMAVAAVRLAAYIRSLGYPARAHHVANYQVLQVPIAVDAGIGELARNGYVISKKFGPGIRLVTVTTDLPMVVDKPVDIGVQDFCVKCGKCAQLCPVKAIPAGDKIVVRGVRKWKVDDDKCYRYWNATGTTCSVCMAVCPWTKPPTPLHRVFQELASRSPLARSLLIWADDIVYGKEPKPTPHPPWLVH